MLSSKQGQGHRICKFGISEETFHLVLESQGGGCYICGSEEKLGVDHDHSCCGDRGKYKTCGKCLRGILCSSCNAAIGLVGDSSTLLTDMVTYLEKSREVLK